MDLSKGDCQGNALKAGLSNSREAVRFIGSFTKPCCPREVG
jgi:hypothetical protein